MSVPPDTKDWTWVLERRCPECGLVAAEVEPASVAGLLREQVGRWRAVLHRPDVAVRSRPDAWSPLEYACHVRDVFDLYALRLKLMLDEADPLFANWDQDATAAGYAGSDPAAVADELAAGCEELATLLDGVTDWTRTGRRSDGAAFTLTTFSQYLLHDPVHHLWDVGG